jgi:hypothetical protein
MSDAPSVPNVPAEPQELRMEVCPLCSKRLESRHCKLICPRCGYFMSRSEFE